MKFILILIFSNFLMAQTLEIELDTLTTLDEELAHVEFLKNESIEKLKLPDGIASPKYLNLFYSWESENDESVSIAVVQNDTSDILYADLNNDEDLTNDGEPIYFPLSQNSAWFDIIDNKDINQKTRLIIFRIPPFADSLIKHFVDTEGNLAPMVVRLFGRINNNEFDGKRRTFFFDDRMGLRRGKLSLQDTVIQIGLFDYSNNGRFNDSSDIVLIDINRDNKLDYRHDEDIFKLNDIISIKNKNYKISNVDPYGLKITMEETQEEATKYFSSLSYKNEYDEQTYILEQDFWDSTFTDIDGHLVEMKNYKGKFLLLNFWGEWCMPCREEVPDLVSARKKYSSKIEYVSFLKTDKLEKAKEFIKQNNVDWVQIKLTNTIEEKFRIYGYPTNILIFPDGKTFLRQSEIREDFFDKYID